MLVPTLQQILESLFVLTHLLDYARNVSMFNRQVLDGKLLEIIKKSIIV